MNAGLQLAISVLTLVALVGGGGAILLRLGRIFERFDRLTASRDNHSVRIRALELGGVDLDGLADGGNGERRRA